MVATIFAFSAAFNQAVDYKMNSFLVPNSFDVQKLLRLFMGHRYIFSYRNSGISSSQFIVFPNHFAINFRLRNCSTSSRRVFLTARAIRFASNSGTNYVIRFNGRFEFSNFFYLIRHKRSVPVFRFV
jgi:hypothetical protein